LVRAARTAGLYVNLITSGMPLDEARLAKLIDAGLDLCSSAFKAPRRNPNEISAQKPRPKAPRLEWLESAV